MCLEHSNFFGVDETFGPIAISLRRERMEDGTPPVTTTAGSTRKLQSKYLYHCPYLPGEYVDYVIL